MTPDEKKYEIDKDAMIEMLQSQLHSNFQLQEEYFELLRKMQDAEKITKTFGNNIMHMSIPDQIIVFRQIAKLVELERALCDKYGFEIEDEADIE